MHSDLVIENRQVYSFWDLSGDIGGFNDFVYLAGSVLMALYQPFRGSGLYKYLVKELFFVEKETQSGKIRRRPARFNFFMWLRCDHE